MNSWDMPASIRNAIMAFLPTISSHPLPFIPRFSRNSASLHPEFSTMPAMAAAMSKSAL